MSTSVNGTPGLLPERLFEDIDDQTAAHLLPKGALALVRTIRPELVVGAKRATTMGSLLSIELAVDDPSRRIMLIEAIPPEKITELEERVGSTIDQLRVTEKLDQKQRRALLGFFGLATITEHPNAPPEAAATVAVSRALFPHQKRAASAIERYLYFDSGRAMLHLPTGAGKTRTAMSIVASHLRSRDHGLVVWLATTRELLEQAATEFEETWNTVGDRPVECHRFWSSLDPPLDDIVDGIVIAGLAKLHSYGRGRKQLWDLGDRTSLVIFDEAHQAVATTYQDLVETIVTRNPKTGLLGLTATPGRTWGDPEVDSAVAEVFHGNKVTLDFDGENPITYLTREGYLASVEFSLLNVEPGLELSQEDLAELTSALDISESLAERLGDDEQRSLRVVQRVLELADGHDRILVFAASVRNAVVLASVCRAAGLSADAVTGNTSIAERGRVIARFKRPGGSKKILINYGVLTTGFDAPAASATVIARPTRSLVLYSQMVGRVIRGPKAGGTESCEVVTVVDTTLPGFGDVTQAFMNWEDVWTT